MNIIKVNSIYLVVHWEYYDILCMFIETYNYFKFIAIFNAYFYIDSMLSRILPFWALKLERRKNGRSDGRSLYGTALLDRPGPAL